MLAEDNTSVVGVNDVSEVEEETVAVEDSGDCCSFDTVTDVSEDAVDIGFEVEEVTIGVDGSEGWGPVVGVIGVSVDNGSEAEEKTIVIEDVKDNWASNSEALLSLIKVVNVLS